MTIVTLNYTVMFQVQIKEKEIFFVSSLSAKLVQNISYTTFNQYCTGYIINPFAPNDVRKRQEFDSRCAE